MSAVAVAISVLLPTVRPALLPPVVQSIKAAAGLVSTEIVIVADCDPTFEHEPWIKRDRNGVIDAVHAGYQAAKGDYIFSTNDETTCEPDALLKLYVEAVRDPWRLLTPKHIPDYPFYYYGKYFAAFPFAKRTFLDGVGGLFDPAYRAFYADPDLSLRVHAREFPVDVIPDAVIHHNNDITRPDHREAVAKYREADRATFRKRWDHLGEFRDP